ncbi:Hypothetical protein CINCED_3A023370 [Cinara cedri]|uniref:Uncharacterized protein n=1 Tax=Cinara cedri TaxID=506608 RepID=A0A5E4N452_9HEMI|nr:Hypothetical protein CINCED_3A023370 [Cinara cedri]
MSNSTSDSSYSMFLTSFRNQSDKSGNVADPCLLRPLSDREEEIRMVQSLPIRIVPNHNVSEVVSRAIKRCEERVSRQIELIENEFISINNKTENQILKASRALDAALNVIDKTLSDIRDRNPDDFFDFDLLRQSTMMVDQLLDKRNQNIDDFMEELRYLEKKRTALIENCYKQHMLNIKKLSNDSFERLYEKYLKNYNTIKLGNFRTYEELRFKLTQLSGSLRQDFALRAHNVKLKIKKNIGESFKNKFINAADNILSDKISIIQTKPLHLINDLNELFNIVIRELGKQINCTIILESSALLKAHLKNLDEMMANAMPLDHDEMLEDIQLLLMKTVGDFNKTIMDSGEHLSPGEFIAFNNEIFTEAISLQQEKIKTVLKVQLFLSDVKDAIKVIDTVLSSATEIYCGHLKRLMDARNTVLVGLEAKFKINDSNLEVFQKNFDVKLESMIQASNETDVRQLEKKCYKALKYINAKIISNQESEIEVVSNYMNLIVSEFSIVKSEVKRVLDLFPGNLNSIPDFQKSIHNETWAEPIESTIAYFKTVMINCQNALHKTMSRLIADLTSSDLLDNEFIWTTYIRNSIDERFNVAMELFENLTIKGCDEIANNRINEIEEHGHLLERHINDSQNISDNLKEETYKLYDEFFLMKDVIRKSVQQCDINELSIIELTRFIKYQGIQIDSVANEFKHRFESLYENVESKYQAIKDSTAEFITAIKTFSEGGNYGQDEATSFIDTLNVLSSTMFEEQSDLVEFLSHNRYESINKIKESLSKDLKSINIELDKKVLKQKLSVIHKLINVTVNQEILNLDKMLDDLRTQLQVVKITYEKEDFVNLSKCWPEILSKMKNFVDFLLETHLDIKALLKPHIQSSIWNTKSKSSFVLETVTLNSANTFVNGKFKFYDYCKTLVTSPKPIDGSRFLNNIYLVIFQYTMESQQNAADLAVIDSTNSWTNQTLNPAQIYHEIMEGVMRKCRTTVLQTELIWIFKLLEYFDFLNEFRTIELLFKNSVLMAYHNDSVMKLNEAFNEFEQESLMVKETSKTIRERFYFKLKPSHGHPNNSRRLYDLLAEFRSVESECSNTLSDVCARIETVIEQMMETYEQACPTDVLQMATFFINCRANLKTKLDSISITPTAINTHYEFKAISESLATKLTEKEQIELAVNTAKQFLQTEVSAVFWPDNTRLWTENVRDFSALCRDFRDRVQKYDAAEKSRLVDWATSFLRDVEQIKEQYR